MNPISRLAAFALLSAAAAPLLAAGLTAGNLVIDHPWSRQTAPTQKVGSGFLAITNKGPVDDRLVSATSPVAAEVQLHTMSMDGGVMRMRQLEDGIGIPAGKRVELKPGSFHMMFVGLKRPFALGETVPVTLRFLRQGSVKVNFQINPVGAAGPSEVRHDH
ncbi:copper chaperone PCu(A)C [Sphingopyxis sp. R3-92]|uniref:copper chaperone PCu(A)C n=1 Tax=Sphingopyxis sp. R3-92 TaxID=3158553 RepID=UPI003EE5162E